MNWRDTVKLIGITYTENAMGDIVETLTETEVFVNKKSVRQSEHYQAMANGLKPEIVFEVRSHDYAGQKKLKFNSKEYLIIREFSKNDEITELVCEGLVNSA